jgi:hypothetical protein
MIEIKKKSEHEFFVCVKEEKTETEHLITLDDDYYKKLTNGEISKEELIKRSFEFLLERESKESILSKFDLKVIKNYFPEYEKKIRNI